MPHCDAPQLAAESKASIHPPEPGEQTAFETYGDIALETGTYAEDIHEKGKAPMKLTGRYAMVWKLVDGKWLLHRDVLTPMPPAPTKK